MLLPQNSATRESYALGTGVFVVLSVTARNKRDIRSSVAGGGRLDKFENSVVSNSSYGIHVRQSVSRILPIKSLIVKVSPKAA